MYEIISSFMIYTYVNAKTSYTTSRFNICSYPLKCQRQHYVVEFANSLDHVEMALYANSVDPDEVAHHEPPHLYLHCLPSVY